MEIQFGENLAYEYTTNKFQFTISYRQWSGRPAFHRHSDGAEFQEVDAFLSLFAFSIIEDSR